MYRCVIALISLSIWYFFIHADNHSDEDIIESIRNAVQKKHAVLGGHSGPEDIAQTNNNRPMILIGG